MKTTGGGNSDTARGERMRYVAYASPLGTMRLGFGHHGLARLELLAGATEAAAGEGGATPVGADETVRQARAWLDAYFAADFTAPLPPLELRGTPFRRRVWAELLSLRAGETLTYGELARRLHTSARAVGGAVAANPVPLVVPCHRVVAASGPGGYSFGHAGLKTALLNHEQGRAEAENGKNACDFRVVGVSSR